jgi:hypothetical protein
MIACAETREVMVRKWYRPEEILQHLRTIKCETGKHLALLDACRMLGGPEQTYAREKSASGGRSLRRRQFRHGIMSHA